MALNVHFVFAFMSCLFENVIFRSLFEQEQNVLKLIGSIAPIYTKDLESNQLRRKQGQLNAVKSLIKAISSF